MHSYTRKHKLRFRQLFFSGVTLFFFRIAHYAVVFLGYKYDIFGRLVWAKAPDGGETVYRYSSKTNFLESIIAPEGEYWFTGQRPNGKLVTETPHKYNRPIATHFEYDNNKKLIRSYTRIDISKTLRSQVSFQKYDGLDRIIEYNKCLRQ